VGRFGGGEQFLDLAEFPENQNGEDGADEDGGVHRIAKELGMQLGLLNVLQLGIHHFLEIGRHGAQCARVKRWGQLLGEARGVKGMGN